ncbi:hypothetical protein ACUMR9_003675 [Vibrio cholerae]
MNFNATLLGQAIFILALVPPLAIVFLIVLILKNDVALAKSDIGQ